MSKRLAKVLRMLSMAIAAPLLPPPNHQLPRDEAGWRWSSLRSAAARVGFGGFRMSKKLSSPSESLFAEAAAERAEDGSAEDFRIFPKWREREHDRREPYRDIIINIERCPVDTFRQIFILHGLIT
jgi:hypothetical protein